MLAVRLTPLLHTLYMASALQPTLLPYTGPMTSSALSQVSVLPSSYALTLQKHASSNKGTRFAAPTIDAAILRSTVFCLVRLYRPQHSQDYSFPSV